MILVANIKEQCILRTTNVNEMSFDTPMLIGILIAPIILYIINTWLFTCNPIITAITMLLMYIYTIKKIKKYNIKTLDISMYPDLLSRIDDKSYDIQYKYTRYSVMSILQYGLSFLLGIFLLVTGEDNMIINIICFIVSSFMAQYSQKRIKSSPVSNILTEHTFKLVIFVLILFISLLSISLVLKTLQYCILRNMKYTTKDFSICLLNAIIGFSLVIVDIKLISPQYSDNLEDNFTEYMISTQPDHVRKSVVLLFLISSVSLMVVSMILKYHNFIRYINYINIIFLISNTIFIIIISLKPSWILDSNSFNQIHYSCKPMSAKNI